MADMSSPGGPQLHRFPGGLRLPDNKAMATSRPLETVPLPDEICLPLIQHIGEAARPMVSVGDKVKRGQPIAEAAGRISAFLHASTSGEVIAIEERPVPHPSGLGETCIVIRVDGKDTPADAYAPITWKTASPPEIRQRIREAGIVGLGGAAFPTDVKLTTADHPQVERLILNAAECEPYISCDDTLMRHAADEIVRGAEIMLRALGVPRCDIAIEDNKPEARQALEAALETELKASSKTPSETSSEAPSEHSRADIRIVTVPAVYPEGGERQLIQVLTGKEVPHDGLPLDIGIVCHNVGTAAAVKRAVEDGEPLIRRIVTVTGHGVAEPRNVEARIGTSFAHLIRHCDSYTDDVQRLIMGGPMMGFAIRTDAVPVIKATNCIFVPDSQEIAPPAEPLPCIRCGECAEVCPASLLPQQLFWFTRARNFDAVEEHDVFDCIECGCCDLVCPSHIPLANHFRFAKTEIWGKEIERTKADIARQRHETRQARLEREKFEQEEKRRRKQDALKKLEGAQDRKAEIEAALQRTQQKKSGQQDATDKNSPGKPDGDEH